MFDIDRRRSPAHLDRGDSARSDSRRPRQGRRARCGPKRQSMGAVELPAV